VTPVASYETAVADSKPIVYFRMSETGPPVEAGEAKFRMWSAPGDHGSTFGGNALATAAVAAVLETIQDQGLLENARAMGERLRAGLGSIDGVTEARGLGLLVAAELQTEAGPVAARALENGLLINAVRPTSIRMAPPLIVSAAEIDRGVELFARTLQSVSAMAGASGAR
jgi:acetylornithine aminotransferase